MNEKQLDQIADMYMSRPRYYEDLGRAHDDLVRCKDCRSLVTFAVVKKLGACNKCGNKRFNEIITLSVREWLKIKFGVIKFANSDLFLGEFPSFWPLLWLTVKAAFKREPASE